MLVEGLSRTLYDVAGNVVPRLIGILVVEIVHRDNHGIFRGKRMREIYPLFDGFPMSFIGNVRPERPDFRKVFRVHPYTQILGCRELGGFTHRLALDEFLDQTVESHDRFTELILPQDSFTPRRAGFCPFLSSDSSLKSSSQDDGFGHRTLLGSVKVSDLGTEPENPVLDPEKTGDPIDHRRALGIMMLVILWA